MIRLSRTMYLFSTAKPVIAIFAGSPSHDFYGAKLISEINAQQPNTYNFVGIGGPLMKEQGLESRYGYSTEFLEKPFFPHKNFSRIHTERPYHPWLAVNHWTNRKVLQKLYKRTSCSEMVQENVVSFIVLGNEFFMSRLYKKLSAYYAEKGIMRPPTFFYDKMMKNLTWDFKQYLDHMFYQLPLRSVNWMDFQYPSTLVGHEGIARAIQYLYSQNPQFAQYQTKTELVLSREKQPEVNERLISEERSRFRQKMKINESTNIFYIAPGSSGKEIKWSIPLINKSFTEMFKNPHLVQSDRINFAVAISAQNPAQLDLVKREASGLSWAGITKIIYVSGQQETYSAMCAADQGLAMNGQIVSECAILQLPIVILDKMPFAWAYLTQLYNNFYNDLNFAISGEAYQELASTAANPYKISEQLFDLYQDPKLRYHFVRRYRNVLQGMIPLAEGNNPEAELQKHAYSYQVMGKKLIQASQEYLKTDKTAVTVERSQIVQKFGIS